MDTFDLGWPRGTATLCTDGWRCRIVWRGARGMGGSIENNDMCKRRVADSLSFAPRLLDQLRARGYGKLAADIEGMAGVEEVEIPAGPVKHWLEDLEGAATWEECGNRRAKTWHEVVVGTWVKLPAEKGNPEWILKRAMDPKGFEYVAAPAFKGLCEFMRARGHSLEDFMTGCSKIVDESSEVATAVGLWSASKTRH